jgi:2-polyprenyl-6-methoxyphenol hydroxylase-like FAD-dependent oxidoreductase
MFQSNKITLSLILLSFLIQGVTGCSFKGKDPHSSNIDSQQSGVATESHPSESPLHSVPQHHIDQLPQNAVIELPASHYLSAQDIQNPRSAMSPRGYDPDYRMLTYRRLENIPANPPSGSPHHIYGVPNGAKVVRVPKLGDLLSSKAVIDEFQGFLDYKKGRLNKILNKIRNLRKAGLRKGSRPSVVVAGLGPVGLLAAIEAYAAGSSVVGIEQRAQYTRPQILRLTTDTIRRVQDFIGKGTWEHLRNKGVVSTSPNWVPNKFDAGNRYLYSAGKTAAFDRDESRELDRYQAKGLELENVDIIRINHLETILAALLEQISLQDPENLRVYYGGVLKTTPSNGTFKLEFDLYSGGGVVTYPLNADVLAMAEGAAASGIAKTLGLQSTTLSNTLYGSTAALRLPTGFDIGLRPIENREGTASVKGIAILDAEKLGDFEGYRWSMMDEFALCLQLNEVLDQTATVSHTPKEDGILLPCTKADSEKSTYLQKLWTKRNGGTGDVSAAGSFLPRTRYFFTAGIAYLGSELTEPQYNMFQKQSDSSVSRQVQLAVKEGHKQFMLLLAKKHMPKEYVEGQFGHTIAPAALTAGRNARSADFERVVMVTEENYSLTVFPVQLRKANQFSSIHQFQSAQNASSKSVRVVALGDTYATTHFFTGSGAVNGLRSAMSLGRALLDGGSDYGFKLAGHEVGHATQKMHDRVIKGAGNAPLDGPFNELLSGSP